MARSTRRLESNEGAKGVVGVEEKEKGDGRNHGIFLRKLISSRRTQDFLAHGVHNLTIHGISNSRRDLTAEHCTNHIRKDRRKNITEAVHKTMSATMITVPLAFHMQLALVPARRQGVHHQSILVITIPVDTLTRNIIVSIHLLMTMASIPFMLSRKRGRCRCITNSLEV